MASCKSGKEKGMNEDWHTLLDSVYSDRITYVTVRPPGAGTVVLERRVRITGSPSMKTLSETGDPNILHALKDLMREDGRAWAAHVLLSAMTGADAATIEIFAADPAGWLQNFRGRHLAEWESWLKQAGDSLIWDPEQHIFSPSL